MPGSTVLYLCVETKNSAVEGLEGNRRSVRDRRALRMERVITTFSTSLWVLRPRAITCFVAEVTGLPTP